MSGKIQRAQIPLLNKFQLSAEERTDFINAKNGIRSGAHRRSRSELPEVYQRLNFHEFENETGKRARLGPAPLPAPQQGYEYIACDLGRDREAKRGTRRLVFECHKVRNLWSAIYYSNEHYAKFTFWKIE